jgi:5-methylcytosine-specific restriction endonuclease McrA
LLVFNSLAKLGFKDIDLSGKCNIFTQKFMKRTPEEVRKIRNTRLWRDKVRPLKLFRTPWCEYCKEKSNTYTLATQVDHIIALEDGGEPFADDNLKSTCFLCHSCKTAEENKKRMKAKKAAGVPLKRYW